MMILPAQFEAHTKGFHISTTLFFQFCAHKTTIWRICFFFFLICDQPSPHFFCGSRGPGWPPCFPSSPSDESRLPRSWLLDSPWFARWGSPRPGEHENVVKGGGLCCLLVAYGNKMEYRNEDANNIIRWEFSCQVPFYFSSSQTTDGISTVTPGAFPSNWIELFSFSIWASLLALTVGAGEWLQPVLSKVHCTTKKVMVRVASCFQPRLFLKMSLICPWKLERSWSTLVPNAPGAFPPHRSFHHEAPHSEIAPLYTTWEGRVKQALCRYQKKYPLFIFVSSKNQRSIFHLKWSHQRWIRLLFCFFTKGKISHQKFMLGFVSQCPNEFIREIKHTTQITFVGEQCHCGLSYTTLHEVEANRSSNQATTYYNHNTTYIHIIIHIYV